MTNVFWVLADRIDFKPLIKTIIKNNEEIKNIIHSIKEIRDNLLDEKGEYYKGKKLASIKINFKMFVKIIGQMMYWDICVR